MQRYSRAYFRAAILLVIATGCGQKTQMGRVTGTVTHKGQPVTEGVVQFLPERGPMAFGPLDSAGRFTLTTRTPDEGVTAGKSRVSVFLAIPGDGDLPPGWKPPDPASIPKKYRDVNTSPLTAEVVAGQVNEFTFELSD